MLPNSSAQCSSCFKFQVRVKTLMLQLAEIKGQTTEDVQKRLNLRKLLEQVDREEGVHHCWAKEMRKAADDNQMQTGKKYGEYRN